MIKYAAEDLALSANPEHPFFLACAACDMAGVQLAEAPGLAEALDAPDEDFELAFALTDGGSLLISYLRDQHRYVISAKVRPLEGAEAEIAPRKALEANLALMEDGICFAADAEHGALLVLSCVGADPAALPAIALTIVRVVTVAVSFPGGINLDAQVLTSSGATDDAATIWVSEGIIRG